MVAGIRSTLDGERRRRIEDCKRDFSQLNDLEGLDERVNQFLNEIRTINDEVQDEIYYNFPWLAKTLQGLVPEDRLLQDILKAATDPSALSPIANWRLGAALTRVLVSSLSQSNKSNAGMAGEYMAEAVMEAAGLQKGLDYRTQFISVKGSNTDVVVPYVEDHEDHKVDAFIAVQISTNDRARLASSELKKGAKKYLITGNGTDASTKKLKDIGKQIIGDYKENVVWIVCYHDEIEREKGRLKKQLEKNPQSNALEARLHYVSNFTLSFSEFAKRIGATVSRGQ